MNEFAVSEKLRSLLRRSTRIIVSTGAGVSAESGVPTFRSAGGLWERFRPEELANIDAFMNNPKLVWEWYNWRRGLMSAVEPNPGHYAIAEWERYFEEFALITQNVDGLHHRAGSAKIYELHGNIMRNKCASCDAPGDVPDRFDPDNLPRCPCGGLMRPDVVWFGELLPAGVIEEAWAKAGGCELFVSVGTSALVQPAASLPLVAQRHGAYTVEVNPERTPLSSMFDEVFNGASGVILPQITKLFS
jgi:NAD-dependent deacetylase